MTPHTFRRARVLLAAAACLAPISLARAQSVTARFDDSVARDGLFTRGEAVGVLQRPHPEYDPVPVRLGSWDAYRSVAVQLEATDNLFATPVGRSDISSHLSPAVRLETDWARNRLQVFLDSDLTGYARTSSKNSAAGSLGFNARRDIMRGDVLQFGGSVSREIEDPTAPNSTLGLTAPVRYNHAIAYAGGIWTLNRLRLTARGDYDGRRFLDSEAAGAPVVLDRRDVDSFEGVVRAEYALNPSLSGFLTASANRRDPLVALPASPQRQSNGYSIEGGVNFDRGLWRGELGLGYLSQNSKNPLLPDVSGLSAHARLDYFPTDLTTLRLNIDRSINEPGTALSGGYLFTRAIAEVDHELLRNVILTGRLVYEDSDYVGFDRDDRAWSAQLSGTYAVSPAVVMILTYRHYNRDSRGTAGARSFDVNSANFGLTYRF